MEYQSEEMQSKYAVALSKYNTHLHDDEVQARVDSLITRHLDENNNIEVKKELFSCIDLTSLKCTDSEESIMKLTEKVNEFVDKYPDLSNVAAICVYPNMAEIVSDTLEADDVKIACVAGGFPSSQTFTEVKVAETAMAIHTGAEEIDIVIPVGKFLCGDYEGMCDEIGELKDVCGEKTLKVILETGALMTATNIIYMIINNKNQPSPVREEFLKFIYKTPENELNFYLACLKTMSNNLTLVKF